MLLLLATGGLVTSACGGGGDDGDTTAGNAVPAQSQATTPDELDGAADATTPPVEGAGSLPLVVDVGGRTYEFEILLCEVADNGSLTGSGTTPGGGYDQDSNSLTGAFVEFRIQPEGSPNQEVVAFADQHFVRVADEDEGLYWNAGGGQFLGAVTFEDSYISSWTLDGTSASGQASFIEEGVAYDQDAVVERVPGTFQLDCS